MMILALAGFLAVLLLASASERENATFHSPPLLPRQRHRRRILALAVLATHCALTLHESQNPAFALITWIGQFSVNALLVALLCTAIRQKPARLR
ncbi:DUF3325 family protein [Acetobacter fallax]|uniref:DUF3325 family protein n=1 Tax=Acetobacter fallax TaxID=1737473 RepID=A0ABX0K4Y2_9PROT|nr:DUF3325 family protein [Acetobacter fallax]NHO31417.1 DUF3325 family protein [Acetobacter fallax]NHO35001.1 DUF3325 family protein [Acetobacter fallax]